MYNNTNTHHHDPALRRELIRERLYHHVVWDIESEADPRADEEYVRSITPPYPAFDSGEVDTGPARTEEDRQKVIAQAQAAHAQQEAAFWKDKMSKRALSPATGKILTIGYLRVTEPDSAAVIDDAGGDEKRLIKRFWKSYERIAADGGKLIGWNSGGGMNTGYDLHMLIVRSWIHNIPIPEGVMKGRFVSDRFIDLMRHFACYQYGGNNLWSLDAASKILGLGNKSDQECTGAQFAQWYHDPARRDEAIAYAVQDLVLTRAIYLRLFGYEDALTSRDKSPESPS
jgi:hypothetical protein